MLGLSLIVVHRLLTALVSLAAEALGHAGFSSCDAWAQLPCGMWNLPKAGIKLVLPALAGRFLPTGPPGKS